MAFTHTLLRRVTVGQETLDQEVELSGSQEANIDEAISDGSTNLQIENVAIDISTLKSLYLESDQDITVASNDATTGAPDDQFTLKANTPLIWNSDSVHSNPLSADVTDWYITNSSGSTANFKQRVLQDATP